MRSASVSKSSSLPSCFQRPSLRQNAVRTSFICGPFPLFQKRKKEPWKAKRPPFTGKNASSISLFQGAWVQRPRNIFFLISQKTFKKLRKVTKVEKTLKIRSASVFWTEKKLFTIAISWGSNNCKKVVWLSSQKVSENFTFCFVITLNLDRNRRYTS